MPELDRAYGALGNVVIPGDGSLKCGRCGARYHIFGNTDPEHPSPEGMRAFTKEHKDCKREPVH